MISQIGIVRLEVIRLEAPELDFLLLKPVQESEYDYDSYKKTECPHHLMVPRQGNAMAEIPASLIASTWSLIVLCNGDATTIPRSFSSFEFHYSKTRKKNRPPGGGEYCHIWAIKVCAAVKGMVFKQFTLGYGI